MGIISVENTDRLFWLGRYSERVFTTIRTFTHSYDTMIDAEEEGYRGFCESLDIPMIYSDREDFIRTYTFSASDPNSIMSNLLRAYDNAILLREEIGSEALAHIQLSIYAMEKAALSESPLIELQLVLDHIAAFWGTIDDTIDDEQIRSIIKAGKRVERIDLYARLGEFGDKLVREVRRLRGRLKKTCLSYSEEVISEIEEEVNRDAPDNRRILASVSTLFR